MATITSLDFNVGSHWDGSGIAEARRDIDALRADLERVGAMRETATVNVAVDDSALVSVRRSLTEVGAIHETAHVTVEADTAAITRVRDQLDAVGRMRETAHVTVEADTAAIARVREQLDAIGRVRETAHISVEADTAAIARVRAELAAIPNHITTHVDVDTDRAHTGLTTLTRDAGDLTSSLGGIGNSAGGAGNGLNSVGNSASGASGGAAGLTTALGYMLAAMALIGPVSALASAAVLGVLGGAFIGLGVMVLSQTGVIKSAMADLKTSVGREMTQAAQVMKGPLLAGIEELKVGLKQLQPVFTQAFAAAAPLIKPLVDSLLNFTRSIMPGVVTAIRAAGPVFQGLNVGMKALGEGLSNMFAGMAAGAKGAGAALATTLSYIGQILGVVGRAFGQMADAGSRALGGLMSGLLSIVSGAMKGFVGAVKAMDGSLGPFLATVGRVVGMILQQMLPVFGQILAVMMKGLMPVLQAVTPALIIMGQAIGGAIVQALRIVTPLLGSLAKEFAVILIALTPLIPPLTKIMIAGLQLMVAVITPLLPLLTLMAKLIGALAPVINVAAVAITLMSRGIQDAIKWLTSWSAITAAFSTAWNATWNALKIATLAIWDALRVAWSATVNGFVVAWNAVSGALVAAWNAVWNAMLTAAKAIWSAMQTAWAAVVQAFATVWSSVSAALVTAWNAVWNGMLTAAKAIWSAMQTAWTAVVQAFASIWQTVSAALVSSWNTVWNGMKTAAQAIWTAMQTAWTAFLNAMKTAMTTIMSAMQTAWSAAWNAMKTAAQAVWSALQTAFGAFSSAMKTAMDGMLNAMKTAWSAAWNAMKTAAVAVWDALRSAFGTFSSAMKTALSGMMDAIKNTWSAAWNAVKTVAENVWDGLRTAFGKFASGMKAAVGDLVSGIKTVWAGIKDAFEAPIKFVIGTVINGGIIKAVNWVIDKLGGGSSTVPDVPMPFAQGGHVQGPGTGTSDSIPAVLSNGEYVLRADAVRRIGVDRLDQMNSGGLSAPSAARGPQAGYMANLLGPGALSSMGGHFADGGLSLSAGDLEGLFSNLIKAGGGAAAGLLAKAAGAVGGVAGAVKNVVKHIPVIGGFLGGGAKKVQSVADSIKSALMKWGAKEFGGAASGIIKLVTDKLLPAMPGANTPLGAMGTGFAKKVFEALAGKVKDLMGKFMFDQQQKQIAVTATSVAGAKSVQQWAPTILQALALAGAPASWLGGIESLMAHESGGNPNAINRTDSNAKAGIPSQGLMQVIPPTFAAYHQAGTSNNILDPLANIAAAINYIQARYGHVPGSPYASGTNNATPGMHLVGENGPEMVMFSGGESVKTSGETALGGANPGASMPAEQLSQNLAQWQSYMSSIRNTSDSAWKGVGTTADSTWSEMRSGVRPFADSLSRAIADSGANIVASNRNTWGSTRSTALSTWADERSMSALSSAALLKTFSDAGTSIQSKWKNDWTEGKTLANTIWTGETTEGTKFNTDMQKNFSDTGTAIQTKWKQDWTDGKNVATKTWSDEKAAFTQFGTDVQKLSSDTGNTIQANWKTALTTTSTDTTQFWTDTKAKYTDGSTWLTGTFFPPVNDLMVTKLPASFATSVTNIGTGWTGIEKATHDPVGAVVDVVYNKGIVGVWNLIAKAFGAAPLATFTMPAFATGGAVNGPGTGTSDSVVARLSAGEHVMTASEVRAAGGHGAVARWRSSLGSGSARTYGNGDGRYAAGGAVVPPSTTVGGNPSTPTTAGTAAAATNGGGLGALAAATLGSIAPIANPLINAAVAAGKSAVDAVTTVGSGMRTAAENMGANMGKTVTSWITANDVLPTIGGGSDTAAQAWADSQVGKPYVLGGDFVNGIDCSEYQSGIAKAILGETPSPWFTTFAFNGATAPTGFKQNLTAPYMVGVTNVGVGHMAGTLNGKNYEATPPAVRSGPSARGWNDPMFSMHYGFEPSIQAAVGAVTSANHLAIIDAAMKAAGVPPPDTQAAWESGMNIIITHESGWNANAVNNTDINAQNGVPSQGLAQVIPPTFAAYHVAGTSTNILDPLANVAAAINYIVHVYGSINNVPGVRSVNAGGAYLPYRNGTKSAMSGMAVVGEVGPEVMDLGGGGQRIHSFDDIMNKIKECSSSAGSDDTAWKAKLAALLQEVKDNTGVSVSVPITVHGGGDAKEVVRQVEAELLPKLRMLLQQHTGRRTH